MYLYVPLFMKAAVFVSTSHSVKNTSNYFYLKNQKEIVMKIHQK